MLNVPVGKKSLPIWDTHWLAVSRLMILASGHGSGMDRQCSNSDVSCGGTVGSSCGWPQYLRDLSLCLLSLEASYTLWSCGPCCWTKAYKYS